MKVRRWVAAGAVLAATTALAACSPPSSDDDSSDGGSGGSDAASATSAADLGGMDALVEAAQDEGTLNVIALPPDWANYGNIIKAFEDKYDITVKSAQPDVASPARDTVHDSTAPSSTLAARSRAVCAAR